MLRRVGAGVIRRGPQDLLAVLAPADDVAESRRDVDTRGQLEGGAYTQKDV
ncbi:MAG: hypothetical protein ACE5MK_07355 [Acidobacteriota bacterium]